MKKRSNKKGNNKRVVIANMKKNKGITLIAIIITIIILIILTAITINKEKITQENVEMYY